MAISRTTQNLERAGDEVARIARMVKSIIEAARRAPADLRTAPGGRPGRRACCAKRWTPSPGWTPAWRWPSSRSDDAIDARIRRLPAQADHLHDGRPAHHFPSLDLLFLAKAIERVGDHAKNIAEQIIFIVKGGCAPHRRWQAQSVVGIGDQLAG
jgi:phosphate transport system protein